MEELPEERYLDREESWLRFAQRVLELAQDPMPAPGARTEGSVTGYKLRACFC